MFYLDENRTKHLVGLGVPDSYGSCVNVEKGSESGSSYKRTFLLQDLLQILASAGLNPELAFQRGLWSASADGRNYSAKNPIIAVYTALCCAISDLGITKFLALCRQEKK